jgi:hypothetical protein
MKLNEKRKRYAEILAQIEERMDARDEFHMLLQRHFDKCGHVPRQFIPAWNTYQRDKRPWRHVPKIRRRLRQAARLMLRNELSKQSRKDKRAENYLNKQLRKMRSTPA